jgi:hypothetical protein
MAQWGNKDAASNSVLWGTTGFFKRATATNRNAFYDNVSRSAYVTNQIVGQFGVDTTEVNVTNGPVVHVTVTNAGSGYSANVYAAVTGGGGSGANVTAVVNSTGRVSSMLINTAGSSYENNPTVTIPAPPLVIFNGNTAVSGDTISITGANSYFAVGDYITYAGNTSSTPVGLVDSAKYYVVTATSTGLKLSTTLGGTPIVLVDASGDNTSAGGATLRGSTATAVAVVGGGLNKGIAHSGWNVRTVGTGGRAGRVQYETLVAMGSMAPTTDGADDAVLPDASV